MPTALQNSLIEYPSNGGARASLGCFEPPAIGGVSEGASTKRPAAAAATRSFVGRERTFSALRSCFAHWHVSLSLPPITASTVDPCGSRTTARPDRNESGFPRHAGGASLTH